MTKLELTIGDTKVSWENPSDYLTAPELIKAFSGIMTAHTFTPESVNEAMHDYTEEAMLNEVV